MSEANELDDVVSADQARYNVWFADMERTLLEKHNWSSLMLPFETAHHKSVEMFRKDMTPQQAAEWYDNHFKRSFRH